jgi:hypothetical protein
MTFISPFSCQTHIAKLIWTTNTWGWTKLNCFSYIHILIAILTVYCIPHRHYLFLWHLLSYKLMRFETFGRSIIKSLRNVVYKWEHLKVNANNGWLGAVNHVFLFYIFYHPDRVLYSTQTLLVSLTSVIIQVDEIWNSLLFRQKFCFLFVSVIMQVDEIWNSVLCRQINVGFSNVNHHTVRMAIKIWI